MCNDMFVLIIKLNFLDCTSKVCDMCLERLKVLIEISHGTIVPRKFGELGGSKCN